jgi:hypothetical protein
MGLLEEVTQWLGENIVQPVKKGAGKYSDFMGDMEEYLKDKGDETINGMVGQDAGDQEINPMMAGTMSPLDFVNKGSGINPQMTAAQQAAATQAADMVLPGKKAGLVGRIVKGGLKAAGLIGTGYALKKGASGKPEDAELPLAVSHGLEYTPEQAEEAWTKKVAEEKAKAAETSAPKEEPFDINAIADKYGAEVGENGGLISNKKVSKQDGKGLVYKGYIKNEKSGKTTHIYGAKPQEEKPTEGTPGKVPTREEFYKSAAAQVKKNLGIDPDTFNPVTEAKKVLEADGEYQYMKKRLVEGNFTPQKRAQIQDAVNEREQQVTRELTYKTMLAKDGLKRMLDMFDKNKDKFGVAPAGSTLYSKETGEIKGTTPGKSTYLSAGGQAALDKAVDRAFLSDVPEAARQMGGKVYDSIPEQSRAAYDQVLEQAGRIMLDASNQGKAITPQEAVRMAKEKTTGAGAINPPKDYKDSGKTIGGKKVYVSPDGKKGWTAP